MKISSDYSNKQTIKKGAAIGTAAGLVTGALPYIKNRKDVFQTSVNNIVANCAKQGVNVSRNKILGMTIALAGAITATAGLIGGITGGLIGKAVQKHNEKNTPENNLEECSECNQIH